MSIELTDNLPHIQDAINQLLDRVGNLREPMADIAAVLADASERAFADQADPETGEAWPDLSDVTKRRREETGHWPGQILQVTGGLASSIDTDSGPDYAQIGTNKIYAPTMYFGADKGEFGEMANNRQIPWGDIPARHFMGINAEDGEEILDILDAFLAG